MENNSRLKPLKVKVSYPKLDHVMVLVKRDSLVSNLIKEIQETLRKLFPYTSYGPISSIRKDNGRVLLPQWYPVDPLLRDEEEVVVSYEPLDSDSNQYLENGVYCSRSNERNDANYGRRSHLPYDSTVLLNGSKNDSTLPLSVELDHSPDFLRNVSDVGMDTFNVQDVEQFVDRVLQHNEAGSMRKRKGETTDTAHRYESEASFEKSLGIQKESPFKKLKTDDIVDADMMLEAEIKGNENVDLLSSTNAQQNKGSKNKVAPDPEKSNNIRRHSSEPKLKSTEKAVSLSDMIIPSGSKVNTTSGGLIQNLCEVDTSVDDARGIGKHNGKKKKKHKKEHREKSFIEAFPNTDDYPIGCHEESSAKSLRKKRKKKGKELEPENNEEKCKLDENVVTSIPAVFKPAESIEKYDQDKNINELMDDEEGKTTDVSRGKKKKKKKLKEKIKGNAMGKENADLEPVCSSPSIPISEIKESGIGSDSTILDIEKKTATLSNKGEISGTSEVKNDLKSYSNEHNSKSNGLNRQNQNSGINEPCAFSESDLTKTNGDASQQSHEEVMKNCGIQIQRTLNECLGEKANAMKNESNGVNDPYGDAKKASRESKSIKKVKGVDDIDESILTKPTFDDETDAEIRQLQSKILKVVDDVVEESDYSQSLIKDPLDFSLVCSKKSPRQKGEGKNLTKEVADSSEKKSSQKLGSATTDRAPEQNTDRLHGKISKNLDGGRVKGLGDDKKGKNVCSTKKSSESRRKGKREISTKNAGNLKNSKSAEERSVCLYSDTSSLSFSDCAMYGASTNNDKKDKKESLKQNEEQLSKKEVKPKKDAKKKEDIKEKQDEVAEPKYKQAKGKRYSKENKNSDDVGASCSAESPKKRRRSRKRSRDSTRKSVAKVQDWLSQISEDVPTETELEPEKHESNVGEDCELGNGKESSLSIAKTKVIEDSAANPDLCIKKGVADGTERDVNTSAAVGDNRTEVERDESPENESKKDSGVDINNVSEKSAKDICKTVDKSKSRDGLSRKKPVPECPQTLKSTKTNDEMEDEIVNLKFDVLVEDVGSVISPKVNMPLRSKTTRSSYHQKSLTGFLSHEDQKRFQSKLRSKTSPSAK